MNTLKFTTGVATLLLFAAGCKNYEIATDKDNSIDFTKYKTFAWYAKDPQLFKNDGFDNQIMESNIKNCVSAELKRRGMTVNVDNPDLLLDFNLMVEKKNEEVNRPVYSYPYNYGFYNPYRPIVRPLYYPAVSIGYQTIDIPYQEGTLTISAIDRATNRLIWRGWSVGTVNDAQTYETDLPRDIHDIFKKYPLNVVKKKNKTTTAAKPA